MKCQSTFDLNKKKRKQQQLKIIPFRRGRDGEEGCLGFSRDIYMNLHHSNQIKRLSSPDFMPLVTVHIGGQNSITLFPLHHLALINSHCPLKEGEDPRVQGENITASPPSLPPFPAKSMLAHRISESISEGFMHEEN